MRRYQRIALLAVAAVVIAAIPAVVFATRTSSRLDRFLQLRESALVKLDRNTQSPPPGVQHRMPLVSRVSPTFPERQHIESVVSDGAPWYQDGHHFYELTLSDEVAAMQTADVAVMLEAHFADGLEALGLNAPMRGRSGFSGDGRATQGRWWRDRDGHFIVTISVVVDQASKAAHVDRFIHERFD